MVVFGVFMVVKCMSYRHHLQTAHDYYVSIWYYNVVQSPSLLRQCKYKAPWIVTVLSQ